MKPAVLAVLLLGPISVSGALAQVHPPLPPPSLPGYGDVRIPTHEENLDTKAVRQAMVKFAGCITRRRPKEASDFVLNVSEATWTALKKRIDESCALESVDDPGEQVTVSSNSTDLLFALAEVLVQKKLGDVDPAQIASAAKLPPSDALGTVGECAVRANPSGARDLLETKLNSKEERQAVQTLQPAIASCIPAGVQVGFDLTSLRGTVAANYYRLAFAPNLSQSEAQR